MSRYAYILLAASAWTIFVWVTRIRILFGQGTGAFKTVHAVLIIGSLAFGIATGVIGLKLLKGNGS